VSEVNSDAHVSSGNAELDEIQAAIRARQSVTRRETVVDRPYDGRLCATCHEAVLGTSFIHSSHKRKKKKKKKKEKKIFFFFLLSHFLQKKRVANIIALAWPTVNVYFTHTALYAANAIARYTIIPQNASKY
jgi:hypothetical protein